LAKYFGKKVAGKFGLRKEAMASRDSGDIRLQLWSEEPVQELLQTANMKLCGSMDSPSLAGFLERSKKKSFDFGEQWARVLSLECALRVADRAKLNFER
jgi:hypothetical protein